MRYFVAALVALSSLSATAATKLQCNKQQTRCLTQSTRLSIGDKVGIFNDDGDLVAKAEVSAIRGSKRALKIAERHGVIRSDYALALIEYDKAFKSRDAIDSFRVYKAPPEQTIGASYGFGNTLIGGSSDTNEWSAYSEWAWLGDTQLVARGVYQGIEGVVNRSTDEGEEEGALSVRAMGALGGVSYSLWRNHPKSLRTEFGVGLMHISAKVAGDPGLVSNQGFDTSIKNGPQFYVRGSLGGMINFDDWHITADFAQSRFNAAISNFIVAGVSKDLK